MNLKYIIKNNNYTNINQILINEFSISSRLLHKLIINNKVSLNGNLVDTRSDVKINDEIVVNLDFDEDSSNIVSTKMDLKILYEDEYFLILDKPANIAIHPSHSHFSTSLSNGVKYYFESINLKRKIRPINRLDLNTSGIVIFAKSEYIQECLIKQMAQNIFKKEYLAIVDGFFENKSGIINLPISRKDNSIIERCVDFNGQKSITKYEVLNEFENYSLIKCYIETGRTHQIRVHMSYLNHPIIGDTLYGNSSHLINRQALHSYKISFIHPISKEKIEIISNLPDDMKKLINT